MFNIITFDNDDAAVLRKKASRIADPTSPEMIALVPKMIEAMRLADGTGLAAPQVGLSIRLFVIETGGRVTVVFNPVIIEYSEEKTVSEEGCLSVPNEYFPIERFTRIRMEYQDIEGKKHIIDADGFLSTVLQHEYDHLDGVLIIDRFTLQHSPDRL